jgi:hypothetical protein
MKSSSRSSTASRALDLRVVDSLFEPGGADRKVHVDNEAQQLVRYRVWLYLEGRDLPYVKQVTYRLHDTFEDPNRVVPRTASNPNCALAIWTWGIFEVLAVVEDKSGNAFELRHKLSYGEQLKENLEYVRKTPIRRRPPK